MTKKKTEQVEDKVTFTTAKQVRDHLISLLPVWRRELAETRKDASGSQYVELTGRLEFLQFLMQVYSDLPIEEE